MRKYAALFLLLFASLACNLERVIDPSLPTSTLSLEPVLQISTSTPEPEESILAKDDNLAEAELAYFNGDWERALEEYEKQYSLLAGNADRAKALLGMARVNIKVEEWALARNQLLEILENYQDSPAAKQAPYFLALVFEKLENYKGAADAYAQYLLGDSVSISSTILEWKGDAHVNMGDYAEGIAAYQLALNSSRLGNNDSLESKIGDSYYFSGDYQSALITYQQLYMNTSNDYLKSQMDLSMGRVYTQLGEIEQAYMLYLDAVENFPLAYSSYVALLELVNDGVEVNEFDRGLVDYYAATNSLASGDSIGAAELFSVATAAFDRYLLANEDQHESSVHHFRALSLRGLDDYEGALQEWQEIINNHAFEAYWAEAYSQKAFTEWAFQDDYDAGITTLLGFVASTPSQSRSSEFLFTAGQIAARDFQLANAASIWERVGNEYPNSEYHFRSLSKREFQIFGHKI